MCANTRMENETGYLSLLACPGTLHDMDDVLVGMQPSTKNSHKAQDIILLLLQCTGVTYLSQKFLDTNAVVNR